MYWEPIIQLKMSYTCLLVVAFLLLATTKINGQYISFTFCKLTSYFRNLVAMKLYFLGTLKFSANSPKGRLLTPEEGCGYSKAQNNRVIGGAPAKIGAWPWYSI